jgi:DNA-binding NarL/FixJ family response regulator
MMAGRRILIAVGVPSIAEALAEILSGAGLEVVGTVADAETAIRECRRLQPDVVLMDVRMPVMTGIDATRRILEEAPETKVIVLSAYDDPGLAVTIREAGAVEYLAKGTPTRELIRRIVEVGSD